MLIIERARLECNICHISNRVLSAPEIIAWCEKHRREMGHNEFTIKATEARLS